MEKLPELKTKISAVTLYRDGARIERTGKITLEPGTHKLRIANLTQFLDKESIRISGTGHATIVSFDSVDVTQETTGYARLDTLIKRKEQLEKQKNLLDRNLSRLEEKESYYKQVLEKSAAEFSRWIPAGESDLERLTSLETITSTQLEKTEKARIKIFDELEQLQKEIARITREIDKFRQEVSQYEVSNSILLNIEAHKAGACQFTTTYFVHRAAWAPTYDFDLSEEKAHVDIHTVVINNSQEDWDGIRLTVSTATSRPATIIKPSPYLIRVYSPPAPRRSRAAPVAAKMDRRAEMAGEGLLETRAIEAEELPPTAPPEMEISTATALETGGIHVFVLPDPVKVPADGEPHSFLLSRLEFGAERKFFWNAVDFAEAIEVTSIENGDTVLLPGKAKVYRDNDYLGETVLDLVAPHEKVEVGTRFTYDLKVEKKLIAKSAEKSGLTRGKVAREYKYELTLKNFRKTPSPIKIMDRIPHSDSEIIKVESKKFSHKPTEEQLGVLSWEHEIPSEGEVKITYSFEVEYPQGTHITPPLP